MLFAVSAQAPLAGLHMRGLTGQLCKRGISYAVRSPDLVTTKQLRDELIEQTTENPVRVLDARSPALFKSGYIPTAQNVPLNFFQYLLHDSSKATMRRLADEFAQMLGETLGVSRKERVVVYEQRLDNNIGASCRGVILLKYLGVERAAVLHGGMAAWMADNLRISHGDPLPVKPVMFDPMLQPGLLVDKDEMRLALANPNIQILDCRDESEWVGEVSSPYGRDFCRRSGRIPGAKWVEWTRLLEVLPKPEVEEYSQYKAKKRIELICSEAGIVKDKPVYIYCFKGARAANTQIGLRHAGFTDVRNYMASWNEWANDPQCPIDDRRLTIT